MEQKFFICKHCGKIIAVVKETNAPVICCGEKMEEINQNNCVGKQIGLYKILYECDYKSKDGHRLFRIKCSECGRESDIAFKNIKYLLTKF